MPKKLPYIRSGGIILPRPPSKATHIMLTDGSKKAVVAIKDADTLIGVQGSIKYLRRDNKGKVLEVFDSVYTWNGKEVEEVKGLIVE